MFKMLKEGWSDKKFIKSTYKLMIPGVMQAFLTAASSLAISFILGFITNKDQATATIDAISLSLQIFMLCLLACTGVAVVGNFLAGQYLGKKDTIMLQQTTRWKIITSCSIAIFFIVLIVAVNPNRIIGFLSGSEASGNEAELVSKFGAQYTYIILPAYFLVAFSVPFMYTLNLNNKSHVPLIILSVSVAVNISLAIGLGSMATNSSFGTAGTINLNTAQVVGITTVIGRIVEFLSYVIYFLITKPDYLLGKGNIFYVSRHIWKIGLKNAALLVPGEMLYQFYVIVQSFIIAHFGGEPGSRYDMVQRQDSLAGINVVLTMQELFWSVLQGFYIVVPILISEHLGRNEIEKAKENSRKLLGLAMVNSAIMGLFMGSLGFWVPDVLYSNLDDGAKELAKYFLFGLAANFLIYSLSFQILVIVRSGPNHLLCTLSDQLPFYVFWLPLLVVLLLCTDLEVKWIMLILCSTCIFQITTAVLLYKYSNWAQNLTIEVKQTEEEIKLIDKEVLVHQIDQDNKKHKKIVRNNE